MGVLPLRRRGESLWAPVNWHTPRFGLLAEHDRAAREISHAVFAGRPRSVGMDFLDPDDVWLGTLRAAGAEAGYAVVTSVLAPAPYLRTDGDVDEWRASLGAPQRREVRRRFRRLTETGPVSVQVSGGPDGLDNLLADGFAVEGSGWKDARGTAIWSHANTRRFYEEVARWAAGRGWLKLAFLRLGDRALAFDYCLEVHGRHFLLKTGYDPAYARHAPGRLLRSAMLERAFSTGLRAYEFLGEADDWKLDWTRTTRTRLRFRAFAPSLSGAVARSAEALRPLARPLIRSARRRLRR